MSATRVLLADDHAVVCAGIRNALRELSDLEVVGEVADGPTLFTALVELHPDCLLLDVTMPSFEPFSAIRQMRTMYPAMKILVVSAYDDRIYVQGLLSAGVDGYHLKDQPLSDLRLAVRRVLAGEKWISSRLVDTLVQSSSPVGPISPLTPRQRDLLHLLQQGFDNQAIARRMNLSIKTVENHLTRLYRQLEVQSRLEAANYVNQHPELLALSGQQAGSEVIPAHSLDAEPITMLLVDDNARYRSQLRRMVGKVCAQATIYEAENTAEAVQLTRQITPRLVLVDVVLGEEDGIGCARRIKALAPQSRIVLISAYPDREFHRRGLEAGAIAFLDKKDLDAKALYQVVEDLVA